MINCKLPHTCKIAFKSVLTVLISFSFVLSALAFEARAASARTAAVDENTSAKKSSLVMIADAEEEVESNGNENEEGVDSDYTGHLFLCGTFIRLNTLPQQLYNIVLNTCSTYVFSKIPRYILFKNLKLFFNPFNFK